MASEFLGILVAWSLCVTPEIPDVGGTRVEEFQTCGRACLYIAAHLKGKSPAWNAVGRALGSPRDGMHSFAEIMRAADELGMHPVAAKVRADDFASLRGPAIVHCELPSLGERPRMHFAVAVEWDADGVFVLDAPHEAQRIPWDRFNRYWTGKALFFADTPEDAARLGAALTPRLGFRLSRWISVLSILICAGVGLTRVLTRCSAGRKTRAERRLGLVRRLSLARGTWKLERPLPSRRVLLAILPIALSFGAIATYTCAPETSRVGAWMRGTPWIELPNGAVDFGELAGGEQQQSLVLRNLGRSPLTVEFVESNCGCAVSDMDGETVAPGDDLAIPLSLGVTPGRRYVEITVHCNDPRSPLRCTVSWLGALQPLLVPKRIFGEDVLLRSPYQRAVRLVFPASVGGPLPRLAGFKCDDPRVHVSQGNLVPYSFRPDPFTPVGSAIGHLDLDVWISPPTAPERLRTVCHLDVELGNQTVHFELPVAVSFVGEVKAEPSRVLLCAPATSALVGVSRSVRLRGKHARDSEVEFRDVPSWLEATAAPSTDGGQPSLLFKIQETPPSQFESATVRVVVYDGKLETELPLTVLAVGMTGG